MRSKYVWLTLLFFGMLVLIATVFEYHKFIRYYIGDVITVTFLYFLLKSFRPRMLNRTTFVLVIVFAFLVEFTQYFKLNEMLGLHGKIAKLVLGTTFSIEDLFAYLIGGIIAIVIDNFFCENLLNLRENQISAY